MKICISTTITILLLSFTIFGQIIVATTDDGEQVILKPNKTWEYAVKTKSITNTNSFTFGWKMLVETSDKPDGLTYYYQPSQVKTGLLDDKETWIRIIPKNATVFNKKYKSPLNTAFFHQFLTINCRNERYSLESTVFYNNKEKIISTNRFWNSAAYERIIPGTISESWMKGLCDR